MADTAGHLARPGVTCVTQALIADTIEGNTTGISH